MSLTPLLPFLELEMIHLQMKKYFIVDIDLSAPEGTEIVASAGGKYIKRDMNLMV